MATLEGVLRAERAVICNVLRRWGLTEEEIAELWHAEAGQQLYFFAEPHEVKGPRVLHGELCPRSGEQMHHSPHLLEVVYVCSFGWQGRAEGPRVPVHIKMEWMTRAEGPPSSPENG